MRYKAYAKVNVALKVFPRQEGQPLHQVDSVFLLCTDLFDEVEINEWNGGHDIVDFVNAEIPADNTVTKAFAVFRQATGDQRRFKIKIMKGIPVGSGLGGGSSDAAVVLVHLAKELSMSKTDLASLALQVGSDVPFFVSRHSCARVSGFGERVVSAKTSWRVAKVIFSKDRSLTADVYKEFDRMPLSLGTIDGFLSGQSLPFNDLQPAYLRLSPASSEALRELSQNGMIAQISGSGSAICLFSRTIE